MATEILSTLLAPDTVTNKGSKFHTTVTRMERQVYEQRIIGHANAIQSWKVSWNLLSPSLFQALDEFFQRHQGQFKAWYIIDSRINSGAQTMVRFSEDQVSFELIKGKYANVSVEIQEAS